MSETTQFENNLVYDVVKTTLLKDNTTGSLFYTYVNPVLPNSLKSIVQKFFEPKINGSNFVLLNNSLEIAEYMQFASEINIRNQPGLNDFFKIKNHMEIDENLNSSFSSMYNLTDFYPGTFQNSSYILDLPIAIVDSNFSIQVHDNVSELIINCE